MRYNLFKLASLATLLLCSLVVGCATTEPEKTHTQPNHSNLQLDEFLSLRDMLTNNSPWHTIPNPDNDLWVHIRNGYQIPKQHADDRISQWVDFYLARPNHLHIVAERAQPFLWHIAQAIEERDMPMELALIPMIESSFDPSVQSYSGAAGLWQFMGPTAKDLGLTEDWWHDGRYGVISSTNAALDYFTWLYEYYDHDWLKAIAAYNSGLRNVNNAMARNKANGQPDDVWHLNLPAETKAYVAKLMALRRILAEPGKYDFNWPQLENIQRTVAVAVPHPIDIDVAAEMLGISIQQMRRLNAQIRQVSTSPRHSEPQLLVPSQKADAFLEKVKRQPANKLVKQRYYQVSGGETLSQIAVAYGVNMSVIQQANNMSGTMIRVGQKLAIPRTRQPKRDAVIQHTVQAGESLWSISGKYNVGMDDIRRWNRLDDKPIQPGQKLAVSGRAPLPDFYEVQSGDTLSGIAQKFEVKINTLRTLNQLSSNGVIRVGQRLRLQPAPAS